MATHYASPKAIHRRNDIQHEVNRLLLGGSRIPDESYSNLEKHLGRSKEWIKAKRLQLTATVTAAYDKKQLNKNKLRIRSGSDDLNTETSQRKGGTARQSENRWVRNVLIPVLDDLGFSRREA